MALFSDSMNHALSSINKKKIANKTKIDHLIYGIKPLSALVLFALSSIQAGYSKPPIEFNTDALDISERANIDLDKFARAGYIMPGNYIMGVRMNQNEFPDMYSVDFIAPPDDPKGSEACISPN